MSRLENQIAKPALASFILSGDKPRIITEDDETAIVAWAMKMAYVLDFTTVSEAPPHYSSALRHQFAETLTPPEGATLWIANYMPDRNRRTHSSITNLRFTPRDHPAIKIKAQVSTFAVGKVAFQLLHTFTPEDAEPFDWRKATQDRPEKATLQMWPSTGEPMSWPPIEYFDDTALDAFGNRFGVAPIGKQAR